MKEKKSKEEIEQGVSQFYYETIGMFALIIAAVIVAKLGKIGSFLTVILKVLFGDWYLLIVILILIFGLYLIFNHHSFNFKNQKFLGYIFCLVGVLMLTHFSVHNYVIKGDNSYFSETWQHYKNFIKNQQETYLGGGIIGGIMFYICYSLLGVFGVILVSVIIILLGFTMIIDKPIIELGSVLVKGFKRAKKYRISFNNFFKYEMGNKNKVSNIYGTKKRITLKYLDDYHNINYQTSQEKYLEETKGLIISILNNMNLRYRVSQVLCSYSSSFLSFYMFDEFDCQDIGNKLIKFIEENLYITRNGNMLNIEINNKHISILSLKEMLCKQMLLYNNYLIPIGLNIKNQLEEVDLSKEPNFLIIGDANTGIRNFIASFILSCIIKLSNNIIEFSIFDELGEWSDYHFLFKKIDNGDIKDYFSFIINEIDQRVNELSLHNIHLIDEYNIKMDQEKKEKFIRKMFIIELDDYNCNYDYQYIDDKIMYIVQVGRDVGIYVTFISRNIEKITSVMFSLFKYKLIFSVQNKKTTLIETMHLKVLNNKGECLFFRDSNIKRIQTPKISLQEINKIAKDI